MCLTIPKKVISVRKNFVEVISEKRKSPEKVGAIIKVKKNDWVLTQNRIIVSKITKKQASEINKYFNKKII
jgi:hydrogenase maturation factor